MKRQHLFSTIVFSLLISFPAIASDWVYIVSTKQVTTYLDKQSIKGDTISRKFWIKHFFKNKEIEDISGKYYVQTHEYWEIDCNDNMLRIHEVDYYNSDGKLVNSVPFTQPPTARIIPDSLVGEVEAYVCSFKQTK